MSLGSDERSVTNPAMTTSATIHATALIVGHRGILIRGPSGSGKSRLALTLLQSAGAGFARLVGDDRIHLEAVHGRLLMRPATALAGLIEIRGLGIVRAALEPVAVARSGDRSRGAAMRARLPGPGRAGGRDRGGPPCAASGRTRGRRLPAASRPFAARTRRPSRCCQPESRLRMATPLAKCLWLS